MCARGRRELITSVYGNRRLSLYFIPYVSSSVISLQSFSPSPRPQGNLSLHDTCEALLKNGRQTLYVLPSQSTVDEAIVRSSRGPALYGSPGGQPIFYHSTIMAISYLIAATDLAIDFPFLCHLHCSSYSIVSTIASAPPPALLLLLSLLLP